MDNHKGNRIDDSSVYLPKIIDNNLLLEIIGDNDVYLIEIQKNTNSINKQYNIIGSNIFTAKNGREIHNYVIATEDIKTCKRIISDLRFMLQENGIKVRRYDNQDDWTPLTLMIYPNASNGLINSIDYIESLNILKTLHSDDNIEISNVSDDQDNEELIAIGLEENILEK